MTFLRPSQPFSPFLLTLIALAALLGSLPSEAGTQPLPFTPVDTDRGAEPHTWFAVPSDLDTINAATGNLTLRLPLGQAYPVGPLLSYQLRLVNNSSVWQHLKITCHGESCTGDPPEGPLTFASANPQQNAGLGWELHFGQLYSPDEPANLSSFQAQQWPVQPDGDDEGWLYVAPDGATHSLYALAGRPSEDPQTGLPVRYSKDGSYLRLRQVSASETHIEHPNGTVSVFEKTGATTLGTLFCGNDSALPVSGCWRFRERRDSHGPGGGPGNAFWIDYSEQGTTEVWTIHDSTGRSHRLFFGTQPAETNGGDGQGVFQQPNGDEWGDLRRILTRVETAAFGGATATWNLTYRDATIRRGRPHDGDQLPGGPYDTLRTKLLTAIEPPAIVNGDSTPASKGFGIQYSTDTSDEGGRVWRLTLPTGGMYVYIYGQVAFPTQCDYKPDANPDASNVYHRRGVIRKKVRRADGTLEGIWKYQYQLAGSDGQANWPTHGQFCSRATYRITTIDAPAEENRFRRTVLYHSVIMVPQTVKNHTASISDWRVTDTGLPFTKDHFYLENTSPPPGPGDREFLSREELECVVGGSCTRMRSHYVRYAMERPRPCEDSSPDCYQSNPVVHRSRIVYDDDGDRYVSTSNSNFDGVGNFERTSTTDNFDGIYTVVGETDFTSTGSVINPGSTTGYLPEAIPTPGPSSPWFLGEYGRRSRTENGRTYVSLSSFRNGVLKCTRRLKGSAAGPNDLVRKLTLGRTPGVDAGLPTEEILAGGDAATLSGTGACSADTASGPSYVLTHENQFLQTSRSFIAGFPNSYRADIDRNTGMPSGVYDVANQRTAFTYDLLGRRTLLDRPLGGATTERIYRYFPGGGGSVEVSAYDGAQLLSRASTEVDDLGRRIRAESRRPRSGGGFDTSAQEWVYDDLGRVVTATTLQDAANVAHSKATRYSGFDIFDRPRTTTRPDGAVETVAPRGDRLSTRTVDIAMGSTSPTLASTVTHFDAQGRVSKVVATDYQTTFGYDPEGQVVRSERRDFATQQTQVRTYGWDARGQLLTEVLPELGSAAAATGTLRYTRDALGNPHTVSDPQRTLIYLYDGAGRPTRLREGASKLWKEWSYGTANAGADKTLGKLVEAVRYNYPAGETWAVVERYAYAGREGRISQKRTELHYPELSGTAQYGETFVQGWVYDALGNVGLETYPECITSAGSNHNNCSDGTGDALPPANFAVTRTHSQGILTRVAAPFSISADYQYHPNLQLSRADYGNTAFDVFDEGTNGMARPARLRTFRPTGTNFETLRDSGNYLYDGDGNISLIGAGVAGVSESYRYDAQSRLVRAQMNPGILGIQSYTYDGFDNLLSVSTTDSSGISVREDNVDARKNRRLGDLGQTPNTFYDNAGNMTQVGVWEGTSFPVHEMAYDSLNLQTLYRRWNSNGTIAVRWHYIYGPGDYRLIVWDNAGRVRHVKVRGLDGKVLREWEVNGDGPYVSPTVRGAQWAHVKDFVYGADGLVATRQRSGSQRYFHKDHLGTPRVLTRSLDGAQVSSHRFYPFGQPESAPAEDEPTYKFTGHERDIHNLTDYMLARTYAFPFQRFVSVDPGRDGWNLYAYVANNPIRFVDPDGRLRRDKGGNLIFHPGGIGGVLHGSDIFTRYIVQAGFLYTDKGTPIPATSVFPLNFGDPTGQIRHGMTNELQRAATDYSNPMCTNCHGTTFADGRFAIHNDSVQTILDDDGYVLQKGGASEVGDVVIYRDGDGNIVHSATVYQVAEDGTAQSVSGLGGLATKSEVTAPEDGFRRSGYSTIERYRRIE